MAIRVSRVLMLCAALIVIAVVPTFAQQEQSPEAFEAMMMEAFQKYGSPGDQHSVLANMVGSWDCTVMMWMGPGMPPDTGTGTAETSAMMGGRYFKQDYTGQFGGAEFHGMALNGYDRFREEYFTLWIDDMSTGISFMRGTATDSSGTTILFKGTMDDFIAGQKDIPIHQYLNLADPDTYIVEMFSIDENGKEIQNMKLIYERRK